MRAFCFLIWSLSLFCSLTSKSAGRALHDKPASATAFGGTEYAFFLCFCNYFLRTKTQSHGTEFKGSYDFFYSFYWWDFFCFSISSAFYLKQICTDSKPEPWCLMAEEAD